VAFEVTTTRNELVGQQRWTSTRNVSLDGNDFTFGPRFAESNVNRQVWLCMIGKQCYACKKTKKKEKK